MSKFIFHLDPGIYQDLQRLQNADVTGALDAGTKMLATYTRQDGEAMGVRRYGDLLDSMVTKGPYHEGASVAFYVTYEGTHPGSYEKNGDPSRNGAVAFYNEYGARGRPKRPFNQRAVEAHETEIVQEIEDNLYK